MPTLAQAAEAASRLSRLHSLLVSWRGELVLERYFNGARPARPSNIKSASKSIIATLVGIAIDRGLIAGVRQPITAFFPELLSGARAAGRQDITIEDLLTMRSGLESTSGRNYGAWVRSADWVRHALHRPLLRPPGTDMIYSTGNSHLLSAIVTRAARTSTWQFAQDTLAGPLGFTLARWPQDPQGVYFGGNDMLLTPKQMVAFGQLYLSRGRANGRQILPSSWIDEALTPRVESSREANRFYGYGWWMRELAGRQAYYAWGFGGQYIFLIPALDLVVVTTSSTAISEERWNHRLGVFDLVERLVIEPVGSMAPLAAGTGPDAPRRWGSRRA